MRAIRSSLSLPLLVARVLADHEDGAVATDDLALLAHRLDRRSYLHDPFPAEFVPEMRSGRREGCRCYITDGARRGSAHARTVEDSKGATPPSGGERSPGAAGLLERPVAFVPGREDPRPVGG